MSSVKLAITLKKLQDYVLEVHGEERRLGQDAERVLDRYATELVKYVRERWPVDTGTSRMAWSWRTSSRAGTYAIELTNRMYYASDITDDGTPDGTPLWSQLIAEGWKSLSESFYVEIKSEVDAAQQLIEAAVADGVSKETAVFDVLHPYDGPVLS